MKLNSRANYFAEYRRKNKEKFAEYRAEYYRKNKEKFAEYRRKKQLKWLSLQEKQRDEMVFARAKELLNEMDGDMK